MSSAAASANGGMSSEYKILKIPITKDKTVFYYYKRYTNKNSGSNSNKKTGQESIVTLPEDKTLYVCHFNRPIEEPFVQKFFGMAGKLK